MLRNELVRTVRHRECHERAARWLEQSGEIVSALDQWLLAERPRDALRLLAATSTELYDQGHDAVILRTIAAIPREIAATDVAARIDFAVSHILGPRAGSSRRWTRPSGTPTTSITTSRPRSTPCNRSR